MSCQTTGQTDGRRTDVLRQLTSVGVGDYTMKTEKEYILRQAELTLVDIDNWNC